MKTYLRWIKSEDGATAMEYALIAGGISLAIVAAIFLVGGDLENLFNSLTTAMSSASGKL